MKREIKQDRERMPSTSWAIYLASIFYGMVILVTDGEIKDVLLTPLLGLWWLMGMAFYRNPREVAIIGGILLVFVVGSLLGEGAAVTVVRGASFMISTTLAVMLSKQRCRAEERLVQILKIIGSVPAKVVATDEHGTIIAASHMAEAMLGKDFQPLCGHMFTDLFMSHVPPGEALRAFHNWFHKTDAFDCELCLIGQQGNRIAGFAECSGTGSARILVMMIQPAD